jgi:hypothetical protein
MGLFDFWREKPITTTDELVEEVARSAAFVVNKAMFEYSRARSGILSNALLKEKEFQVAIEKARWSAFPLAVGYVTEIIYGLLAPAFQDKRADLTDALVGVALRALAHDDAPVDFFPEGWGPPGAEVEARLRLAMLAAPKTVRSIPDQTAEAFFDAFPLHETVKQHDFVPISNNLRSLLLFRYEKIGPRLNLQLLRVALLDQSIPMQPVPKPVGEAL